MLSLAVVLLLSGCAMTGNAPQFCKVIDPDLAQGLYSGTCRDGLADGYGEVEVKGKGGVSGYRGDFLAGKKHGKGIKVMPNGDRYEGGFRDDYRDGRGVYVWGARTPWAGDRYEGEYRRDQRHGWGTYQWGSGDRYEGAWQNDLRMGPSVMEVRRAQAAAAVARSVQADATVCAEEQWDGINHQLIRGKAERVADQSVQVRIIEVEQGRVIYKGETFGAGDLLTDDVAHWRPCGQN